MFKLDIHATSGVESFLFENFSGHEGLSRLYQFDPALLSDTANVKLKSLIGLPATLAIELADRTVRHVNGNQPVQFPGQRWRLCPLCCDSEPLVVDVDLPLRLTHLSEQNRRGSHQ